MEAGWYFSRSCLSLLLESSEYGYWFPHVHYIRQTFQPQSIFTYDGGPQWKPNTPNDFVLSAYNVMRQSWQFLISNNSCIIAAYAVVHIYRWTFFQIPICRSQRNFRFRTYTNIIGFKWKIRHCNNLHVNQNFLNEIDSRTLGNVLKTNSLLKDVNSVIICQCQ